MANHVVEILPRHFMNTRSVTLVSNESGSSGESELFVEDFVGFLPDELSLYILRYLSTADVSRASGCCHAWRNITNQDQLWLPHCMHEGWLRYGLTVNLLSLAPLAPPPGNSPASRQISPHYTLQDSRLYGLSALCKWKEIYLRARHLKQNWQLGRYHVAPILRGHREKVTAMATNGETLVTGGADSRLIVWDLSRHRKILKLNMHNDHVTCIAFKGNTIVSGCGDGLIRVIDSTSGTQLTTFSGHPGGVDHLQYDGSVVISSGADRTLRVWSMLEGLKHSLSGHTDDIECIHLYRHLAVTGSWDNSLIMWDISKGTALFSMHGHQEVVLCVQFDLGRVVSGSADGSLRIWNTCGGECMHMLEGHEGDVYCLVFNRHIIASGSADSTVRLWSHQGVCIHVLHGHLGVVRCLHIDDEKLVSGGDQKKIIVWDYHEGRELIRVFRHPTLMHRMLVTETQLITASPEHPGTVTVMNYW